MSPRLLVDMLAHSFSGFLMQKCLKTSVVVRTVPHSLLSFRLTFCQLVSVCSLYPESTNELRSAVSQSFQTGLAAAYLLLSAPVGARSDPSRLVTWSAPACEDGTASMAFARARTHGAPKSSPFTLRERGFWGLAPGVIGVIGCY